MKMKSSSHVWNSLPHASLSNQSRKCHENPFMRFPVVKVANMYTPPTSTPTSPPPPPPPPQHTHPPKKKKNRKNFLYPSGQMKYWNIPNITQIVVCTNFSLKSVDAFSAKLLTYTQTNKKHQRWKHNSRCSAEVMTLVTMIITTFSLYLNSNEILSVA